MLMQQINVAAFLIAISITIVAAETAKTIKPTTVAPIATTTTPSNYGFQRLVNNGINSRTFVLTPVDSSDKNVYSVGWDFPFFKFGKKKLISKPETHHPDDDDKEDHHHHSYNHHYHYLHKPYVPPALLPPPYGEFYPHYPLYPKPYWPPYYWPPPPYVDPSPPIQELPPEPEIPTEEPPTHRPPTHRPTWPPTHRPTHPPTHRPTHRPTRPPKPRPTPSFRPTISPPTDGNGNVDDIPAWCEINPTLPGCPDFSNDPALVYY